MINPRGVHAWLFPSVPDQPLAQFRENCNGRTQHQNGNLSNLDLQGQSMACGLIKRIKGAES